MSTALVISKNVKGTFHPPTHAKTLRALSLCQQQVGYGSAERGHHNPSKLTLLTFKVDHDVIDVLISHHETINELQGKRVASKVVKLGHNEPRDVLDYAIFVIYRGRVYWWCSRHGERLLASIAHGVSPAVYELLFPYETEI
jgi:hypothetical protein